MKSHFLFQIEFSHQVRFVDYGNCARCSFDDLRVANMFGDIPVLSRLYQLDNIRSKSEDGLWPDYVREFCGDLVVERQCNVIVTDHLYTTKSPDQPTLCKLEIFTRDRDLATALVTREMADWIGTSSDQTDDIKRTIQTMTWKQKRFFQVKFKMLFC